MQVLTVSCSIQTGKLIDRKQFLILFYNGIRRYDGLAQFGDTSVKQSLTKRDNIEDEVKEHDREPAEGEVEAVQTYCNICLIEPFQSALVIPWKAAVAEKNVLKAKASTHCGNF